LEHSQMNCPDARQRTVLVVDDDEDDRFLVTQAFASACPPHRVIALHGGGPAIDYLQNKPPFQDRAANPAPDVMLLDLKMPRENGFDVLLWLRKHDVYSVPVIVLTGSELARDKEKAMALGAREYHVKKANHEDTKHMVRDICDRWLPAVGPA